MSDRLLVSTRKGLFVIDRGPGRWAVRGVSFLAENVTLAGVDPRTGGWYAALNLGHFGVKLKFSPDCGATWEERAVPVYPEGETIATADGKPRKPAVLSLLWAFGFGGADQPGRVWAGTLPGGLFRSDDDGRNWELVRGLWDAPQRAGWFGGGADLPGIHSICVDPRDSKTVRLAVSCGGVWQTTDDGTTWELLGDGLVAEYMPPDRRFDPSIQDPHLMTQCPGSPDHFWIQHHNGVFYSTTAARTWRHVSEATPSGFGFAVAVHPTEPGTAWFVPAVKDECRVPVDAKLVVTRTRDGGRTFESLRTGLPDAASYDLVFRHALAIDGSGDRLAFGSTTGGVWVSEDQGDRWTMLKERLPPVHAVCFV
jgi:photosystem II stability/assembly factor-like uncharacterized protein